MKKNKHTLRKRINKSFRKSIMITICVFSITLLLGLYFFLRGAGYVISSSISGRISSDLSSPMFLKQHNLSNIKDFSSTSTGYIEWKRNLDHQYNINSFFDPVTAKNFNDSLQIMNLNNDNTDSNTDTEITPSAAQKTLENDNIKYPDNLKQFVNIKVYINDNEIYTNERSQDIEYDKYILKIKQSNYRKLPLRDKFNLWLYNYSINESTSKIYDFSANSNIGYVTATINKDLILGIMIAFILFFLVVLFIAMILSKIFANLFSIPIIMPLTKLQQKMDAIANGNLEDALNYTIELKHPLMEIQSLANSTNTIISKVKDYAKQLENQNCELEAMTQNEIESNEALAEKNNQLQNILDNIGQGFLTFGSNLIINDEYSLQCIKIFNREIKQKHLSELLYSSDMESQKFIDSVFAKLFQEEDSDKQDLYLHLLPEELEINSRFIGIEYKLVKNINTKEVNSIMVILTDRTEKRALEFKMEEEKNKLKMVVKAVVHYNDFMDCIEDYKHFYSEEISSLLESLKMPADILSEIFRNVHNFKGNFSQYDMINITENLHIMENALEELKHNSNLTIADLNDFFHHYDPIKWLDDDMEILKSFLGDEFFEKRDTIQIDKKTLLVLEDKMSKLLSYDEYKLLLPDIKKLRYKSFKELLQSYPDYVEKLAQRLNKNVAPLYIEGEDIDVDLDYYRSFTKTLVHVFRNCLDHGIETIEDRVTLGKDELGNIKCTVSKLGESILLKISDDGIGIDLEAIKTKAIEKGIISKEQAETLSNNEIISLIFKDDFSTKDVVTEVSGRGVGLYSVVQELIKIGGSVKVNTKLEKGTEFIFTIPIEQFKDIPKVHVDSIVNGIVKSGTNFIRDLTSIEIDALGKVLYSDKVELNTISSLISIRGIMNGIVIVSFNEALMEKIVNNFIIDNLSSEEIKDYMEDVAAECSNIILGNSLKNFGEIEDLISIGTPTIVCYNGASIKYSNFVIASYKIKKDNYEVSFSFISDEIIQEED